MTTPSRLRSRAAVLLAAVVAPVAACSSISDPGPCADGVCVQEVRVTAVRRYLAMGDTSRLSAELTAVGGAATTFNWQAVTPTVATVDENGLVTARGLGRAVVAAVPTADTSLVAAVYFDVVSGDTSAVPTITAVTDPATRSRVQPRAQVGDSVDVTLEYVSGRNAGQAVREVQLRLVGSSGRDTTVALTPPAGTGIQRSTVRLRFGPQTPGGQRAFPTGVYSARAVTRLANGQALQVDITEIFTIAR
jgi:hypothetical protein